MVNNGTVTNIDNLRYAKRDGIPMTLKVGHKFIHALMVIGTYKTYPLDLWHRELVIQQRYGIGQLEILMDDTILTLYYIL